MITGCWIDRWKGKEVSRVYVCVCVYSWLILCFEKREKRVNGRERKTLMLFLSSTIVGGSEPYCGAPTVTSCHSILVGRKRQREWRGAGAGQNPDNARLPLQFTSFSPARHLTGRRRLLSLSRLSGSRNKGKLELNSYSSVYLCTSTW